jgi:flagellar biosynthesis/type III secretory pathway protein FliH
VIQRLPHDALLEATAHRVVAGGQRPAAPAAETIIAAGDLAAEAYRLAYVEGYEAGESDGLRDAKQRMQKLEEAARDRLDALEGERERLSVIIEGLGDAARRHGETMETQAFEVALTSLAHAFGKLQEDGKLLHRLCAKMADEYRAKALRLVVSVQDRSLLPEHIDGLEVDTERGLAAGECRLMTDRGHIESSFGQRLGAIYEAMLRTLGVAAP